MAMLKIVPKEDWAVLSRYLDDPGVVLLPESCLEQLPEKDAEKLREMEGDIDYDFGDQPDVSVDLVLSPQHYAISTLLESEEDEEEL